MELPNGGKPSTLQVLTKLSGTTSGSKAKMPKPTTPMAKIQQGRDLIMEGVMALGEGDLTESVMAALDILDNEVLIKEGDL